MTAYWAIFLCDYVNTQHLYCQPNYWCKGFGYHFAPANNSADIISFGQDKHNELYLLTLGDNTNLYKLEQVLMKKAFANANCNRCFFRHKQFNGF